MGETLRLLKEKGEEPEDIRFSPANLAKLIELTERKEINGSVAKKIFSVMFEEDVEPEAYALRHGLKTVNDEGLLRSTIESVIADNPQSAADFRNGRKKAAGFLVGQTMKAMKGKADPALVNEMVREILQG